MIHKGFTNLEYIGFFDEVCFGNDLLKIDPVKIKQRIINNIKHKSKEYLVNIYLKNIHKTF